MTELDNTKIETIKNWLGSGSINIFGLPFAGKDTVCEKLADLLGGIVIGGGEILRSQKQKDHIADQIDKGALAPTDEYLAIVLPYLSQLHLAHKPLILSSVGRWHGEESSIITAAHDSGHPLKAVVLISITEQEAHKRWALATHLGDRGQRKDDAQGILDTRINEFISKTTPVIDFYRSQGLLIEVDGLQSRSAVLAEVVSKLAEQATLQASS
jgi:adenylate kinase